MYADVTVVVDGAVEDQEIFHDETLLDEFVDTIRDEAEGHGYPTEIFVQYHEHEVTDGDCTCAQYETDGHPTYAWNVDDD